MRDDYYRLKTKPNLLRNFETLKSYETKGSAAKHMP